MIKETIHIANLKCSGCGNTITDKLNQMDGIEVKDLDIEGNAVTVSYSDMQERNEIVRVLRKLGYPEQSEDNGLLLQAKSYASCALGRMKN